MNSSIAMAAKVATSSGTVRFTTSEKESLNTLLRSHGIRDQQSQRAFRRAKKLEIECEIDLSPVILESGEPRDKMAEKFKDIRNAIIAMNKERESLNVLLPIEHAARHGFPHLNETEKAKEIEARLRIWASLLGLQPTALFPLAKGIPVTITDAQGIALHFPVWKKTYLSENIEKCMDQLKQNIIALVDQQYVYSAEEHDDITPLPFLTNKAKPLHELITQSLKNSNIDMAPLTLAEINNLIQHVLIKTLTYMAQQTPEMKNISVNLSSKNGAGLETDGTSILHALYAQSNNKLKLATEFGHEVTFIMEEIIVMLEKFKQKNHLSFYCGHHKITKQEPMRVLATVLNAHLGFLALETCNSHETHAQRVAKDNETRNSSPDDDSSNSFLDLFSSATVAAARLGFLQKKDSKEINQNKVDFLLEQMSRKFFMVNESSSSTSNTNTRRDSISTDSSSSSSSSSSHHENDSGASSSDEKELSSASKKERKIRK